MAFKNKGGLLIDDSEWKKMKSRLSKGFNLEVEVGFFPNSVYPDGTPVATVAYLNEEGHTNGPSAMIPGAITPARPFIRAGFMPEVREQKWLTPQLLKQITLIAEGRSTWEQLYKKLGPVFTFMMQDQISKWAIPANSALTVRMKGSNDPLIDTGQMMESVDYMLGRR